MKAGARIDGGLEGRGHKAVEGEGAGGEGGGWGARLDGSLDAHGVFEVERVRMDVERGEGGVGLQRAEEGGGG